MRALSKIAGFVLISLIFSSCTHYQLVTMHSNCKKDPVNGFIFENDTMRVRYSFNGANGPFRVELYNKLNKPILVDWKKSALIINEEKFSYWMDEASVNLNSTTSTYHSSNSFSNSSSETSGTIFKNEKLSFIPPATFIKYSPRTIQNSLFVLPPHQSEQKVSVAWKDGTYTGYEYPFNQERSPLSFRSYLVISTDESFTNPVYLDHKFWVSEIFVPATDDRFLNSLQANQFFIKETKGVIGGCTALAFLGFAILLAVGIKSMP